MCWITGQPWTCRTERRVGRKGLLSALFLQSAWQIHCYYTHGFTYFTLFFKGLQGPPGLPGKVVSLWHTVACLKPDEPHDKWMLSKYIIFTLNETQIHMQMEQTDVWCLCMFSSTDWYSGPVKRRDRREGMYYTCKDIVFPWAFLSNCILILQLL